MAHHKFFQDFFDPLGLIKLLFEGELLCGTIGTQTVWFSPPLDQSSRRYEVELDVNHSASTCRYDRYQLNRLTE